MNGRCLSAVILDVGVNRKGGGEAKGGPGRSAEWGTDTPRAERGLNVQLQWSRRIACVSTAEPSLPITRITHDDDDDDEVVLGPRVPYAKEQYTRVTRLMLSQVVHPLLSNLSCVIIAFCPMTFCSLKGVFIFTLNLVDPA